MLYLLIASYCRITNFHRFQKTSKWRSIKHVVRRPLIQKKICTPVIHDRPILTFKDIKLSYFVFFKLYYCTELNNYLFGQRIYYIQSWNNRHKLIFPCIKVSTVDYLGTGPILIESLFVCIVINVTLWIIVS